MRSNKQQRTFPSGQRIIFLLLSLLAVYSGKAQEVYTIKNSKEPQSINRHALHFIDDSNLLTHDNVIQQGNFKLSLEEIPNLNVIKGTSWSTMKVTCAERGDYYFSLEPIAANIASLYQKKGNGAWTMERQGQFLPDGEKDLRYNHMLFKLNLQPGDTVVLLLKIHDYVPVTLILQTGTLQSFVSSFQVSNIFYCFGFGIIFMMLLYNLYLFVTQSEKVYLYYVLYCFFSLLFTIETSGFGAHLPYFMIRLYDFSPTFPPALSSVFAMLFTLQIFKGVLPKWLRIFIYIYCATLLIDVIMGCVGMKHEAFMLIQPTAMLFIFLHMSAGIIAYRKKHSSSGFYLMGFGAYALFFTYFVLCTVGVLTRTTFSFQALNIGLTIEVIMLSFALGDKMKAFMLEKEKAQKEALHQAEKNERLVREQNIVLEQKVKERTAEVMAQKHLIEEKHKEITDSINYAERIQRSFLATKELLDENLKDYFVFFQPKDIVSGDFFWASELSDGRFALAAADSTGHGVPGAIMSLLNITSLEKAVEHHSQPSAILDHTRNIIIERLKKDGSAEGGKDGMDCSLCVYDFKTKKLVVAASNNPVWIIRENEIREIFPDKMPVGKHDKDSVQFKQHEVLLQKGDVIYTFTDGLPDQFGGPKGKKFMYKQFKELLLSVVNDPMEMQKEKINAAFTNWRGAQEQVDDVCVIGVRV